MQKQPRENKKSKTKRKDKSNPAKNAQKTEKRVLRTKQEKRCRKTMKNTIQGEKKMIRNDLPNKKTKIRLALF